MPILTINTNVPVEKLPKNLKEQATDIVNKILGKPVSYIAIHVKANQDISFANNAEPAALCDLISIGALSVETNKKFSAALCEILQKQLNISPDRVYIAFRDYDKANCGWNNTTFHDLI